jgi:hypothetical protein
VSWRKLLPLPPVVPALALLGSVWLPFVNAERLWCGMPSLYVWAGGWVLALTPAPAGPGGGGATWTGEGRGGDNPATYESEPP